MLSRLRALFLAVGVGMFEGRHVRASPLFSVTSWITLARQQSGTLAECLRLGFNNRLFGIKLTIA
jgi:hypothetical protein